MKTTPDLTELTQLNRAATFQRDHVNHEQRTVEIAFSSEMPVMRWFGEEVLSHEANACDLSRLNDGGAVLFNHDWHEPIGVVERAWIDGDKKGRAIIRFGNSTFAQEKFQDVQDGILRHISVGYCVQDMTCDNPEADDEHLRYIVTHLQPYEISLVTVPADTSVGIGRQAEPTQPQPKKERNMNQEQNTPKTNTIPPETQVQAASVHNTAEHGIQSERERVAELIAIGEAYAEFGGERMAADAIRNGHSKAQLQAALLNAMRTKPTATDHEIGLNAKEQQQYSLARALHAAASGDWSKAGF